MTPTRARRRLTVTVLAGVLVPLALAGLGYLAAGTPHVDCGDTARTAAFYRVAVPFFALAAFVGAAALVYVARTDRSSLERPWASEAFAVLVALVAIDALLPGGLHHPAGAVVVALGLATLVGAVITGPITLALVVLTGTALVRGRNRETPGRRERNIYVMLVGWVLVTLFPALIVGLSLNADPLCFSF